MKVILTKSLNSIINFINKIGYKKYFIIDKKVLKYYGFFLTPLLFNRNYSVVCKGEKSKNIFYIFKILNLLLKNKFNKKTYIIAIGGGVTGDIAGFIASIYLRGVYYINIPTTLLAQVDSSIGGKNGVNTFYGKNLIGRIYSPNFIIICVEFLKTLDINEYILGYAEILKISIINAPGLMYKIFPMYKLGLYSYINKIIKISISCKIYIVNSDIYDRYHRFKLNLGHTFAHAIEICSDYKISHSKAVFMGMYLILILSFLLNFINIVYFIFILSLIKMFLPFLCYIINANLKSLFYYICYDKKVISKKNINLILVSKLGKVLIKSYNICIFNYLIKLLTN